MVREKQASEGIVRGEARVTVLYLSEETEGLQSVTVAVPFTCELSDPKLRECQMLQVHSRLLLCEAKPITGRRLYLRVIPELTVLGFGQKQLRFCCEARGKGLQVRKRGQELCLLAAAEERSCTTAQEFDGGADQAEEILLSRMVPSITGCQQIGSKLAVKGSCACRLCCAWRTESSGKRCRRCHFPKYWMALPQWRTAPGRWRQRRQSGTCGWCAARAAAAWV
ncbi:MAG: DUF3794 domain-containing protein [Oscillospiraceae bacterium]